MLNLHVDVGGERSDMGLQMREDLGSMAEQFKERFTDAALEGVVDEEIYGLYLNIGRLFGRSQNGLHSLCPAVWSKHRRWLLMSMICLNPVACSFMDVQFPNGQLTYVAGEGITTSAFLPVFGGLLQAQGQYPGEMKFSFSCKNNWGTCITPAVQWPDKSLSLGLEQALAWKRSGLMTRPTLQFRFAAVA